MKVYKVTLLVIDHDKMGAKGIKENLENEEYTNPTVMDIESVDIGEWDDSHPLNSVRGMKAEFNKLFNKKDA